MKKIFLPLLLVGCILISGCINGNEEDNVKDVIRDYYSAYNNRDADAVVELFAQDVINDSGGVEPFKENLGNVFALADETNLDLKIVRFLNVRILNETAFVNFDVRLTDVDRNDEFNLTFKLVAQEGKWKISEMIQES